MRILHFIYGIIIHIILGGYTQMIPNLMKSTQNFLTYNKFNKYIIEQRNITLSEDGGACGTLCFSDYIGINLQNKAIPLTIQIITIFSLLDSHIDVNIPTIPSGSNFKKRYNLLPSSTDKEIIFKELYRIFRQFRNTVIHNSNSINIDNTNNTIDFDGIVISIDTLYWLYSLVCELFSDNGNLYPSEFYHTGVLRNYYDIIVNYLNSANYNDDIAYDLLSLSSDIRILVTIRYIVENPKYSITSTTLSIDKYNCQISNYRADYNIYYNNNHYFIPDEALDSNGNLNLNDINNWIV